MSAPKVGDRVKFAGTWRVWSVVAVDEEAGEMVLARARTAGGRRRLTCRVAEIGNENLRKVEA